MDLVIRKSRLQGREGTWDIGIQGDCIAAVAERLEDQGAEEIETVFDFITVNAARALRLQNYGLTPGCRADLNVLAAPTIQHTLRLQQPPLWVIRSRKLLAQNNLTRELKMG